MEIIARLETSPRRVYTGAAGFVLPGGRRAQFNVAIRTLLADRQRQVAEYGIGSGVVWDSETEAEYRECFAKAAILTRPPRPSFVLREALRWSPAEGFFLLEEHVARLEASARYFAFRFDADPLRNQLVALAATWPRIACKVGISLAATGHFEITAQPAPPTPATWRVALARLPVDAGDVFLYHKTSVRRVYDEALASVPGYDDAILWNQNGELTETCIANLACELDGRLYTPPLAAGLLGGVYRTRLLADGTLTERPIHRDELPRCRRLLLFNSVRGQWLATLS